MNKRIKKKHMPRYNMYMLCVYAVLRRFEIAMGHKVEHKAERRLSNMMKRNWYKNRRNNKKHEDAFKYAMNNFLLGVVEQSLHPMDYYENKSMEENINE
jgi:hypothetical protein